MKRLLFIERNLESVIRDVLRTFADQTNSAAVFYLADFILPLFEKITASG